VQNGMLKYFSLAEAMRTGITITGTNQTGKTNLAMVLAEDLLDNGVRLLIFDPSRAWIKFADKHGFAVLSPRNESQFRIDLNESYVFDMGQRYVAEIQGFFEAFTKIVFAAKTHAPYLPQIFFIMEEAQVDMPLGCYRSKRYQEAMRLVTVGANFGLRFMLITPFPALVDKTPVKTTRQRYFFASDETNDIRYIRGLIGKTAYSLKRLKVGECYYNYGRILRKIRVPKWKP